MDPFVLVLKNQEGKEYVRWSSNGVLYVGYIYSFNSLVKRNISDQNRNDLLNDQAITQRVNRYFYVPESWLSDQDNAALGVTELYTEAYTVQVIDDRDKAALYADFMAAYNDTVQAFNRYSETPYGVYPNGPDNSLVYSYLCNSQREFDIADNYMKSLDPDLIKVKYAVVDQMPSGSEKVAISQHFSVLVNETKQPGSGPYASNLQTAQNYFPDKYYTQKDMYRVVNLRITKESLKFAEAGQGRLKAKTIMNGVSPDTIAGILLIQNPDVTFEWMNLCSFAYGTPDILYDPNDVNNLVIGTSAANAQMLLFETQIKNAVLAGLTANLTVIACLGLLPNNERTTWYASEIIYQAWFEFPGMPYDRDNLKFPYKNPEKRDAAAFSIQMTMDPLQVVGPTVAEQYIVQAFMLNDWNVVQRFQNGKTSTPVVRSTVRNLPAIIPPVKPHSPHLEQVTVNFFGKTNVPATRERLNGNVFTSVHIAKYSPKNNSPFNFSEVFSDLLQSSFYLQFNNAQFTLVETDDICFLVFLGDLNLNYNQLNLKAFESFLGCGTSLTMGGNIYLRDKFSSIADLEKDQNPSFISLNATTEFTKPLDSANAIILSGLCLQVNILRNLIQVSRSTEWVTDLFATGYVEFNNLQSSKPVVLKTKFGYTENGKILANGTANGVQGLFGLDDLVFDFLQAEFIVETNYEIALTANFTPFTITYQFGGKMTSAGTGLYALLDYITLDDLDDLYNSLFGKRLHIPETEIQLTDVTLSLATADLTIGAKNLKRGFRIEATAKAGSYTVVVSGIINQDGIYFESETTSKKLSAINNLLVQDIQLTINLNPEHSGVEIHGTLALDTQSHNCRIYVEKVDGTVQETVFAPFFAPAFGLSNLFPSNANTILDTLKFSSAGLLVADYDGSFTVNGNTYTVARGAQLVGMIDEISQVSFLLHNRIENLPFNVILDQYGEPANSAVDLDPSIKLLLGPGIQTGPVTVLVEPGTRAIAFELGLSFTGIPDQTTPLNFRTTFELDVARAKLSSIVENTTFPDFMGITGLTLGPNIDFNIRINYAEFAVSGMPSDCMISSSQTLASRAVNWVLDYNSPVGKHLIEGLVGTVNSADLQALMSAFNPDLTISSTPAWINFDQVRLVGIPASNTDLEPGFLPGMNLTGLFNFGETSFEMIGNFQNGGTAPDGTKLETGFVSVGKTAQFKIGSMNIFGKNNAFLYPKILISADKQQIRFKGSTNFLNQLTDVSVEIDNQNITINTAYNISEAFNFSFTGTAAQPGTDFALYGESNEDLNAYLTELVFQKIQQGLDYCSAQSGAPPEDDMTAAQTAYDDQMSKALSKLQNAQVNAWSYLDTCLSDIQNAQNAVIQSAKQAATDLRAARTTLDGKLDTAAANLLQAQCNYNQALRAAQAALFETEMDSQAALVQAQKSLAAARADWQFVFENATISVAAAKASLRDLNNRINLLNGIYSSVHSFEQAFYQDMIIGLQSEIQSRNTILSAVNASFKDLKKSAEYLALQPAEDNLSAQQDQARANVKSAEDQANTVAFNSDVYKALSAAQTALQAVETQYDAQAFSFADSDLQARLRTQRTALEACESAFLSFKLSAPWVTLRTAEAAFRMLDVNNAATSWSALQAANTAAGYGYDAMSGIAESLNNYGKGSFVIQKVFFNQNLSEIPAGIPVFNCTCTVNVLGVNKQWDGFNLDVADLYDFAQQIYEQLLVDISA